MPDPGGLLVPEPIFAVAHVAEGQALHEGPRLEKARLRVFHGPPLGPQVADDLERAKHQPAARSRGRRLRAREYSVHTGLAHTMSKLPSKRSSSYGGPKFGVQVYADDLPAFCQSSPFR